jgi:hypothetical protein
MEKTRKAGSDTASEAKKIEQVKVQVGAGIIIIKGRRTEYMKDKASSELGSFQAAEVRGVRSTEDALGG